MTIIRKIKCWFGFHQRKLKGVNPVLGEAWECIHCGDCILVKGDMG